MADIITPAERALIDAYLRDRGATVIPTGTCGEGEEATAWRRMSAADLRRVARTRKEICALAATLTVPEIADRMSISANAVYRALREGGVFAVGMSDRRAA